MQLALNHGASICGVSFQNVIETWDRGVAQLFLEHGADPVTNAPFARAFKARVKAALGIFLDCKRARPELAEALQLQAARCTGRSGISAVGAPDCLPEQGAKDPEAAEAGSRDRRPA